MSGSEAEGAALAAPAPTGHSRFGASGAHRWTVCHGSIAAQDGADDTSSPEAQEGTAGHGVAALCLQNSQDAIEYVDREVEGVTIDESVCEGVQVYLDVIRADKEARGGKLLIEQRFHLSYLHPEFFGTADCCRFGNDNVLSVYDLKLGRGKIVEVAKDGKPNIQLAYYGLGAIQALARVVKSLKVERVELVIVQPRAWHTDGPVRRATFSVAELEAVAALLVAAAAEASKPNASRVPGDHCTFCKAAGTCPALRQLSMTTAQIDFDDEAPQLVEVKTMTPAETARVLDMADLIETWIGAVRAHGHRLAESEAGVPGWKLVDKQARRKWEDETAAASALQYEYGLDESSIFKSKLLSPAQVEKLLPKPERAKIANLYSAKSSGTTLVKDDNPRPAIARTSQVDFDDGCSTADAEW